MLKPYRPPMIEEDSETPRNADDKIFHRTYPEIHFLIGPEKQLFKVEAELLDSSCEYFRDRPAEHLFKCPSLTPNGFKIALELLRSDHLYKLSKEISDADILNHCFDILQCAEEFLLPYVQDEVFYRLQHPPFLSEIYQHELFLHQLYQMFTTYQGTESQAMVALANCVNGVKAEHDKIATCFVTRLFRCSGSSSSLENMALNNLTLEYSRVKRDCSCVYCTHHRQISEYAKNKSPGMLDVICHETKNLITVGSKITRYLMSKDILWISFLIFFVQVPFIGLKGVKSKVYEYLRTVLSVYVAFGAYSTALVAVLLIFGILNGAFHQLPIILLPVWPMLLSAYYPAISLVGIAFLAQRFAVSFRQRQRFLSGRLGLKQVSRKLFS